MEVNNMKIKKIDDEMSVVEGVIKGDNAFMLAQGSKCLINAEIIDEFSTSSALKITFMGEKGLVTAIVKPCSIARVDSKIGKKFCQISIRL